MPKLTIMDGKFSGKTFELAGDTNFIGRSRKNDISIPYATISRKHLKIFSIGSKFFIEDLKSTNGTSVNMQRIIPGDSYEIGEGDVIKLGKTRLRLEDFPILKPLERKSITIQPPEKEVAKKSRDKVERRSRSSRELELMNNVTTLLKQSFNMHGFCGVFHQMLHSVREFAQLVSSS